MANDIKQRLRVINATAAATLVVVLAAAAAMGVVPPYREGVHKIQESARLTQEIKDLDALTLQVARAKVDMSTRETRLADAETRLPNAGTLNQFLQELAKIAEDAGLQVDALEPARDAKSAGAYKLMSVHLTGTGDWETCNRFLTSLRGANRKLARLDKLSLDSLRDKASERPLCHITVDISTLIVR